MAQKTKRTSHGVAVSTLFSAIALAYGTAAYGGFYPGHIDPGGTGIVPGFHADFVVNIDSNCLQGTGWQATNANPPVSGSGCGAASLYSATVDLYSVDSGDPPSPGVILGHFVLGPDNTGSLFPILGVVSVVPGQPKEIDTDPLGPALGLAEGSHEDWLDRQFWLQFVSGQCGFGCTPLPPPPVTLTLPDLGDPGYIWMDGTETFAQLSNPGVVTFGHECSVNANGAPVDCTIGQQQAPEPGTLGLILGALGGGWIARRRKAKVATA